MLLDWTKKSLTSYIKDIELYKNKIRVMDIRLENPDLDNRVRKTYIKTRNELQNTLDQVETCIDSLPDEDKVIVESNIRDGIPLKGIPLNYSLNSLSRKRVKILNKIVETLNT